LPAPFHTLTVKVVDDESGMALEGALINLSGAGNRLTDVNGTALFLSLPQPVTLTASKFGWIKKSVTASVSSATDVTIRMIKDESAVGEEEQGDELRVYPNPAKDVITVETKESGLLHLFNMDGKQLMQQNMISPSVLLDVTGIKKGIYILRFDGKKGSYYRKVVVQ